MDDDVASIEFVQRFSVAERVGFALPGVHANVNCLLPQIVYHHQSRTSHHSVTGVHSCLPVHEE